MLQRILTDMSRRDDADLGIVYVLTNEAMPGMVKPKRGYVSVPEGNIKLVEQL